MLRRVLGLTIAIVLAVTVWTSGQQPARDTPVRQQNGPASGEITGRVLTADNGRPLKRARVSISAPELSLARGTLTDDSGVFHFVGLPAARYTVAASKPGFVTVSYGQRRPFMPGTPLQLGDDQRLRIDLHLHRGSAIAGRIFDEGGEPMPGAFVRVMRYRYAQGERQLTVAGTGQTDDKGQYRVWGLMPGEYYVSATARSAGGGAIVGGSVVDETETYAPSYYPGAGSVHEAQSVTLALGQEALEINISARLERTSRVSGHVTTANGSSPANGIVNLMADLGSSGGRGPIGVSYGARINGDGIFAIVNVPPGHYTLRARSGTATDPLYASQPLQVGGVDLTNIPVTLSAGVSLSGVIVLEGTKSQPSTLAQMTISALTNDASTFGPTPIARVDQKGRFSIVVPPGRHWIRAAGGEREWLLKSVTVGGRETVDEGIEVRAGETIENVKVVFTDAVNTIGGTVTNERNEPVTDFTVLAFPVDSRLWQPRALQIMTARPDQHGQFQIRGLPPGDYHLAIVDPNEEGEWFDPAVLAEHRRGAVRIRLGERDAKTQDFRIRTP